MCGVGVNEERGTATIAFFQQVAQLQFYALDPRGVEIDGVHRLGEIECDDERCFVLGKWRLLALPCRARGSNRSEQDEQRGHVNRAKSPQTPTPDDKVVQ